MIINKVTNINQIKMNEVNKVIQEDVRVENVLLGIRDGIMMVRKT